MNVTRKDCKKLISREKNSYNMRDYFCLALHTIFFNLIQSLKNNTIVMKSGAYKTRRF